MHKHLIREEQSYSDILLKNVRFFMRTYLTWRISLPVQQILLARFKLLQLKVDEEMFHVKHKKTFTALTECSTILGKVKINNRHSILLICFFLIN
ncbi:MAG: hypothetical protein D3925_11810 [Candidatus Electrothrix sp. AR5]|nr:hypothetical protein [Candidatus Electrothrix sp. AR5]